MNLKLKRKMKEVIKNKSQLFFLSSKLKSTDSPFGQFVKKSKKLWLSAK